MDNEELKRVANRRRKLGRWLAANMPTPRNPRTLKIESSLFSQLKNEGSFGAKVARRLERDYSMGDGYLDSQEEDVVVSPRMVAEKISQSPNAPAESDQEAREWLALREHLRPTDIAEFTELIRRRQERNLQALIVEIKSKLGHMHVDSPESNLELPDEATSTGKKQRSLSS